MMKIGKNMIIALMICFCFVAALFMVIPIRSSISPYDPWLDTDDNGRITMTEINSALDTFGSTGDPTKNVNVANHTTYEWTGTHTVNETPFGDWLTVNSTRGYNRVSITAWEEYGYPVYVDVYFRINGAGGSVLSARDYLGFLNDAYLYTISRKNDVAGSEILIRFTNNGPIGAPCSLGIYMTT